VEITGKRYAGNDWRKLLSTRRGTIMVGVACSLVAAGILVFAMHRYRQSVDASGQPETVLVATQLIQKGTTGTAIASGSLFHPTQIVAKQVSPGAIADASAIAGKVTTVEILPGQQLTLADFATSGDLSSELGPADRAVSVPLEQAPGLVGQVQVGDHVDVYGTFLVENAQGRSTPVTKLLVPNVTVLKAGTASGGGGLGGGSSSTTTSSVVLKVSDADAAKLAFAAANTTSASVGALWLALRSANAATPSPTQLTTIDSILFGTKALPTRIGVGG
jgi:pilus assembly protein CpaB